jgi:2-methylcitrate dehydratase PrpD
MTAVLAEVCAAASAVEQLVRHAQAAQRSGLCAARAAWHVLDWLGCAAAGTGSAQGLACARWLLMQAPGPVPTLAGRSSDAAAAAAYHGALGSALEMDDIHRSAILHPGPVVIPAALAAAHARTSGAQLLGAIVAGYEVTIRVGRALGPSHYALWHSTATAGVFGAAAAAAAVLGLDDAHTAHALALAGTRAGGLWQVRHEQSLGKAWHMAGAARDGLAAAQLAACGLTGPLGVLDGPSGWFAATAPLADASLIDQARATPWMDDVSFKPWPACRHAHPAMDALRELLLLHSMDAADVERIDVHTYADALRFCDRLQPTTSAQARFSIQHALAAWLLWGEPALEHYEDTVLSQPALQALRGRIQLHLDAAIEARYPMQYGARVEVTRRHGRPVSTVLDDCYGDPARPLSPDALRAKARMLMRAASWRDARIDAAIHACAALPQAQSLNDLHTVIAP